MEWSDYQKAVFAACADDNCRAIVVQAVAGSGKTTTIVEAIKHLKGSVMFFAFNKSIASELQTRGVPASTMHSFGLQSCKRFNGRLKINDWKIFDICKLFAIGKQHAYMMKKFCSLAKAYLLREPSRAEWEAFEEKFDIEVKSKDRDLFFSQLERVYRESHGLAFGIDFDDMIALPIFNNWPVEQSDNVIVDEAQDLNPARLQLIARAIKSPNGRLVAVGDEKQAIYGFTGADSESMSKIVRYFEAKTLPLSVSYRCSKAVVIEAQKVVPHLQYADTAREGSVREIEEPELDNKVAAGDFILCRCTAPLVKKCFDLIRKSRRAYVRGKEIGKDLINLVDTISGRNCADIIDFCKLANEYKSLECGKLNAQDKELLAEMLADKVDTLLVLTEGVLTVEDVKKKIESIFSDDRHEEAILLSTVHKAKGLEAENVFILRPDLLPHPKAKQEWQQEQEQNLLYVAITRAKENLTYVNKE